MENIFILAFAFMFIGAAVICTENLYLVLAGIGLVAIGIVVALWGATEAAEEPVEAEFEEV